MNYTEIRCEELIHRLTHRKNKLKASPVEAFLKRKGKQEIERNIIFKTTIHALRIVVKNPLSGLPECAVPCFENKNSSPIYFICH